MGFLKLFTKTEWTLGIVLVIILSLHFSGAPELPKYTAAELLALQSEQEDGSPVKRSLSVFGYIFDVTSAPEFYDEDAPYYLFAGHDCTRAFALSSLDYEDLDQGLDDLSESQRRRVEDSYQETYMRKYPVIGELTELPYDVSLRPERKSEYYFGSKSEEVNAGIEGKCPFTKKVKQAVDFAYSFLPPLLTER